MLALLIGAGAALLGLTTLRLAGTPWWPLTGWSCAAWATVALAYVFDWTGVFGKRPDGRLGWQAGLLAPFLAFIYTVWWARRGLPGSRACDEVAPGLWVGRRLRAGELPAGVGWVVDLTAEHWEPHDVRHGRVYRCLPTLDGCPPRDLEAFSALAAEVASQPAPVFVHCAAGRGRAVVFAASVLLARGVSQSAREALALVRRGRPEARPTRAHRSFLDDYVRKSPRDGRTR